MRTHQDFDFSGQVLIKPFELAELKLTPEEQQAALEPYSCLEEMFKKKSFAELFTTNFEKIDVEEMIIAHISHIETILLEKNILTSQTHNSLIRICADRHASLAHEYRLLGAETTKKGNRIDFLKYILMQTQMVETYLKKIEVLDHEYLYTNEVSIRESFAYYLANGYKNLNTHISNLLSNNAHYKFPDPKDFSSSARKEIAKLYAIYLEKEIDARYEYHFEIADISHRNFFPNLRCYVEALFQQFNIEIVDKNFLTAKRTFQKILILSKTYSFNIEFFKTFNEPIKHLLKLSKLTPEITEIIYLLSLFTSSERKSPHCLHFELEDDFEFAELHKKLLKDLQSGRFDLAIENIILILEEFEQEENKNKIEYQYLMPLYYYNAAALVRAFGINTEAIDFLQKGHQALLAEREASDNNKKGEKIELNIFYTLALIYFSKKDIKQCKSYFKKGLQTLHSIPTFELNNNFLNEVTKVLHSLLKESIRSKKFNVTLDCYIHLQELSSKTGMEIPKIFFTDWLKELKQISLDPQVASQLKLFINEIGVSNSKYINNAFIKKLSGLEKDIDKYLQRLAASNEDNKEITESDSDRISLQQEVKNLDSQLEMIENLFQKICEANNKLKLQKDTMLLKTHRADLANQHLSVNNAIKNVVCDETHQQAKDLVEDFKKNLNKTLESFTAKFNKLDEKLHPHKTKTQEEKKANESGLSKKQLRREKAKMIQAKEQQRQLEADRVTKKHEAEEKKLADEAAKIAEEKRQVEEAAKLAYELNNLFQPLKKPLEIKINNQENLGSSSKCIN